MSDRSFRNGGGDRRDQHSHQRDPGIATGFDDVPARGTPGKITRSSMLPPAPVQRKSQPNTGTPVRETADWMADPWIDAALRGHAPVQAKLENSAAAAHRRPAEPNQDRSSGRPPAQPAPDVARQPRAVTGPAASSASASLAGARSASARSAGASLAGARSASASSAGGVVQMTAQEDAEALEARDGGHSLDRHGPQLVRADLIRRLSTGYAPDGVFSPAPGYSTKFNSYELYLTTRQAVGKQMQVQARHTLKELKPAWAAYIEACEDFNNSDPGPGRAPLIATRQQKRQALETACAAKGPRQVRNQFYLGVRFVNDFANPANSVRLCGNYQVGINHGASIGMGFEGTNPQQVPDPRGGGADFTSYRNFTGLDEIQKTHSAVEPQGEVVLSDSLDTDSFHFGQHFPAPAVEVGIQSN